MFKQVTTQVAQSTVSRLECLGELEASLQVIKKLCGVTWQQSGCTITMSSCLDSLCHAEEYLKQVGMHLWLIFILVFTACLLFPNFVLTLLSLSSYISNVSFVREKKCVHACTRQCLNVMVCLFVIPFMLPISMYCTFLCANN